MISKLTGEGPSSNEDAKTPSGESQMSPGILHLAVAEQTEELSGSKPCGYTGLVPGVFVECGMLGIFPAATAAFRAATHSLGRADVSGIPRGYPEDHAIVDDQTSAKLELLNSYIPDEPTAGYWTPSSVSRLNKLCTGWSLG